MTYIDEIANDILARVDPAILPKSDVPRLFRIYAVLTLAKGTDVTAEDVHDAWAAWEVRPQAEQPVHRAVRPAHATRAGDGPAVRGCHPPGGPRAANSDVAGV